MIPRTVKIPRKAYFWGTTSSAGPHKKNASLPLMHLLRDYLKVGDKEREITRILNSKLVKVDGRVVKEKQYPLGFMDLITIENGSHSAFRIVYDKLGRLVPIEVEQENMNIKPRKVLDKKTIKGGKTMLCFHDGYNLTVENKDISTGDVILYDLKSKKIDGVIKQQDGAKAFLTGGNHVGSIATIKHVEVSKSSRSNLVSMEEGYSTIEEYVFLLGNLKLNLDQRGEVVA
jgi:Ribosomal protein S4E